MYLTIFISRAPKNEILKVSKGRAYEKTLGLFFRLNLETIFTVRHFETIFSKNAVQGFVFTQRVLPWYQYSYSVQYPYSAYCSQRAGAFSFTAYRFFMNADLNLK